jgi:hypothetical protein
MNKILPDYTVRANDIELDQVEIVVDTAHPNKVEIYMLDKIGNRIEGGTFPRDEFMDLILEFYHKNF